MAKWRPENLKRHYKKHPAGPMHKSCWNDLLGKDPNAKPIDIDRYEDESEKVVRHRWLEFEAEWTDEQGKARGSYYSKSTYYVDDRMIWTITRYDRKKDEEYITTCYERHDPKKGYIKIANRPPLGELRHETIKRLRGWKKDGLIKKATFREIYNESK